MKLYHYTSLDHLKQILSDGEVKLTASNLLKPIAPHMENGCFVDETDSYKPVVWFTSSSDFEKVINCGLIMRKTEAAVMVETDNFEEDRFERWYTWAKRNRIKTGWFKTLKRTAPLWETFYVTETPVKVDSSTRIVFRPDIQKIFEETAAQV